MLGSDRLLFRCDWGLEAGLGHLRRCLVLAEALAERGWRPAFLMSHQDADTSELIAARGLAVAPCRQLDLDEREVAIHPAAAGLIVDILSRRVRSRGSAKIDAYLRAAIDSHPAVVLIDGLFEEAYRSAGAPRLAAIVAPYVGAEADMPPNAGCWLRGGDYALLDPAYAASPPARPAASHGRILVTFGGADPQGVTLAAMAGVQDAGEKARVIIGPWFAPDLVARIRAQAAAAPGVFELVESPPDLRRHYAWADIALCGTGGTRYELAAMGVPALFAAIVPEHVAAGRAYAAAGIGWFMGYHEAAVPTVWARGIRALLDDPARRADMADRARRVVDGRGASRVADRLSEVFHG